MVNVLIPKKERDKLIPVSEVDLDKIQADESVLDVHIPQNPDELRASWEVLKDYTKRIAPNPESALQDLDTIQDVEKYHFGKGGYIAFTAIDDKKNPRAIAPAEIVSIDDLLEKNPDLLEVNIKAQGKGLGCIYQIGHDKEISKDDTDFSVATKLYEHVASLLQPISRYKPEEWLGVVTESRKEGPEKDALLAAGFKVLVPNEHYRPPATQEGEIANEENKVTSDLVLLGKDVKPGFEELAANAYLAYSYCEGQNLGPTKKLIHNYFAGKINK